MRAVLVVVLCLVAAAPAAAAALPRGFVGLYGDDAFYGDTAYRAHQFALESRIGVGTIRQPFEWSRVERSPGRFDFSEYDAFMSDAARAGIRVLPVLIAPPAFRSSRPPTSASHAMFPPKSNAAYARFVRAAVARYGSGGSFWHAHPQLPFAPIRAWQVWNEPNIPNFWRSGVSAEKYVALLRAASRAIRTTDPSAAVVAAGLPNSSLGVPFLTYLEQMYRAGARGLFDTLAIHPYSRSVQGLLGLAEQARVVMNRWHDRSRLWITEFGWSTGGDASAFRVSRTGQSQRIAAALSGLIAQRRVLRLRGFVLFKWRDSVAPVSLARDPWPLHAGLLDASGVPKPGFWTFWRVIMGAREGMSGGSAAPTRVGRRNVRLSPLGFAELQLGCASEAFGACAGRLRLASARAVSCGGLSLRAGAELGSAAFRIAAVPALVPVKIPRPAAKLASCEGRLRLKAWVEPRPGDGAAAPQPVEFNLTRRRPGG